MKDQQNLWKSIWKNGSKGQTNDFARRSFSDIKNKPFKTLLDLGCGTGVDSIFFAQQDLDVTAVDFSETGLDHLQKAAKKSNLNNIHTAQMDFQNLDFPPNSFDVIYSHLTLHYFNDKTTSDIFDNLYGLLKEQGLFFIKCKSVDDSLYGKGEKIEKDMFILNDHVRHFFSIDYMKKKLHNFKIIEVRKTSSTYHEYQSNFIEAIATKP